MEIRKAERKQLKVRVGFFGNSGSGKTLSSLNFGYGLAGEDWGKICVIDTEYGRSEAYADRGEFSVLKLEAPFSVKRYIEAIDTAEKAGFEVIIIDSISHEWMGKGGVLDVGDKMGVNAAKWATLTPLHQQFIDRIQSCSAHVICCGRTKESIAMNKIMVDGREKTVIEKIPLKIETKAGFEFEMLISFFLSEDHTIKVEKDNTGLFDGETFIVSKDQGLQLRDWVLTGKKVLSKIEIEKENEEKRIEKEKGKVKEYSDLIKNSKDLVALDVIIKQMKAEISTTETKKSGEVFGDKGFKKITDLVLKTKEKFVPKKGTEEKKETKILNTSEEIKKLEIEIQSEKNANSYAVSISDGSETHESAIKKQLEKIEKMKEKLAKLKETDIQIVKKGTEDKMGAEEVPLPENNG